MIGPGLAVLGMWLFLAVASFSDAYENSHATENKKLWGILLVIGAVFATAATGTVIGTAEKASSIASATVAPAAGN